MREYFRQERLSFHYIPAFWLTRLLFVAMIILLPTAQMFFMIAAVVFSYGFRFETEAESLIPLTDEEYKRIRLTRCSMIWLRYLAVGAAGILLGFLTRDAIIDWGGMFDRPGIFGAFFALQMLMVYESFLEKAMNIMGKKRKPSLFRYVFCSLPSIVCFVYAFAGLTFHKRQVFFMRGAAWIHVVILLAATALFAVYCVRLYEEWKIDDFVPSETKDKTAAKETGQNAEEN